MMIIFKNFFSYVLTYYAFDWTTKGAGVKVSMNTISTIQVVVSLLSIPMCKFFLKFPDFPDLSSA
jgi:hypothetical protein